MPLRVWHGTWLEGWPFLFKKTFEGHSREWERRSPTVFPECSLQPRLSRDSQALQMIRLSLCDLHIINARQCDASQIWKSAQRKERWWKPSALHSWQGGEEGCRLPRLLLFGLWGLRWVSRLPLVPFLFLPLLPFLSHPLFIPPYPALQSLPGA